MKLSDFWSLSKIIVLSFNQFEDNLPNNYSHAVNKFWKLAKFCSGEAMSKIEMGIHFSISSIHIYMSSHFY